MGFIDEDERERKEERDPPVYRMQKFVRKKKDRQSSNGCIVISSKIQRLLREWLNRERVWNSILRSIMSSQHFRDISSLTPIVISFNNLRFGYIIRLLRMSVSAVSVKSWNIAIIIRFWGIFHSRFKSELQMAYSQVTSWQSPSKLEDNNKKFNYLYVCPRFDPWKCVFSGNIGNESRALEAGIDFCFPDSASSV